MNWGALVEKIIQKAQAEGKFDNLPGAGQPLHLDVNPFEDPEWRMANKALANAGFAPEWIELDRDLRQQLAAARTAVARTFEWKKAALAALGERRDLAAQQERDLIADEWGRALRQFSDAIRDINRGIDKYNLVVPLEQLKRARLVLGVELRRLTGAD